MEDAMIQKPWIDTLFRGTKVAKLVSYLRLEFNIAFKHRGVSYAQILFLNMKSQQLY